MLTRSPAGLLQLFEVAWLPAAVEGGSFRTVDSEVYKPAFAGDSLDPLALMFWWNPGAEVEFDRLGSRHVFQLEHRAESGLALVCLDLTVRVRVCRR